MKEVRIRNVSNDDYIRLQEISRQETGSQSVAALAKKQLFKALQRDDEISATKSSPTTRLRVALNYEAKETLQILAKKEGMTINNYIAMLCYRHISTKPILTTNEVQAVQQSNYQLYKLGVNLNQIAKSLNMGQPTSITSQQIQRLKDDINQHMRKVHELIEVNYDRL
ncbi:hypothetical protein AAEX37_01079 [Oligella sp. MSHR50489EDL]|uniref:plasmid mobilization relaxosome protein MobC n=1 Tax=Oligella TaxID=90243 RepID=UPI000CFF7310|nr:plasmid mobilization relaxosome protein MobC [Oligella urethralis]AVL70636.1 hypothetical protein CEQ07_03845 [Oligella urethralis]